MHGTRGWIFAAFEDSDRRAFVLLGPPASAKSVFAGELCRRGGLVSVDQQDGRASAARLARTSAARGGVRVLQERRPQRQRQRRAARHRRAAGRDVEGFVLGDLPAPDARAEDALRQLLAEAAA